MSHEGYAVPHNSPVLRNHLELWHPTSTLKSVNICHSSFMHWHLREEVLCYLLQIWKTMKLYIQRFNVCKISFRLSKLDPTSSSWVAGKLIISFLVCVQKKTIIILTTAIAAGMDRQTMIRKWTCIFCRVMKSGSCQTGCVFRSTTWYVWAASVHDENRFRSLLMDALLAAIICHHSPRHSPGSWHQQAAHDDEKGKMILRRLNKFNNIKAL